MHTYKLRKRKRKRLFSRGFFHNFTQCGHKFALEQCHRETLHFSYFMIKIPCISFNPFANRGGAHVIINKVWEETLQPYIKTSDTCCGQTSGHPLYKIWAESSLHLLLSHTHMSCAIVTYDGCMEQHNILAWNRISINLMHSGELTMYYMSIMGPTLSGKLNANPSNTFSK